MNFCNLYKKNSFFEYIRRVKTYTILPYSFQGSEFFESSSNGIDAKDSSKQNDWLSYPCNDNYKSPSKNSSTKTPNNSPWKGSGWTTPPSETSRCSSDMNRRSRSSSLSSVNSSWSPKSAGSTFSTFSGMSADMAFDLSPMSNDRYSCSSSGYDRSNRSHDSSNSENDEYYASKK